MLETQYVIYKVVYGNIWEFFNVYNMHSLVIYICIYINNNNKPRNVLFRKVY
jgi:hypothetical protein